jgi:hypothetical protein
MRSLWFVLIVPIALMLLAAPAGATLIQTYPDRTAWTAAAGGVMTADFNSLAPGDYSAGVTQETVGFTNFNGAGAPVALTVLAPGGAPGNWNSGNYVRGGYSPGYILATLPGIGATAIGFDLATQNSGQVVQVTFSTGEVVNVGTFTAPTLAFYGVVSDTPITSVRFAALTNSYTLLDNFSYSLAAETPESGTVLLGGIGLAVLVLCRRWRGAV